MEAVPLLTPSIVTAVLPEFASRRYEAGEVVIAEGDRAEEFFVLVSGQVVVSRREAHDQDVLLATLDPGDYFGEMGLLHGVSRNATVRAAGAAPVEVLVTGRQGFERLLVEGGGAAGALARAMLARTERLPS